jgi:hypothetical protein
VGAIQNTASILSVAFGKFLNRTPRLAAKH